MGLKIRIGTHPQEMNIQYIYKTGGLGIQTKKFKSSRLPGKEVHVEHFC